ncbi:hypothetical protein PanWU01x14_285430 [Parasponia andersonii]|uniref:Uncharacterized protein n=1 Tax=Parasponia andersonii TaxID=3476 RepID=A0A2P5AZH5_PARAD|nr:hypothetical protein PanWU01x14_285430 [Parasponia andersonii]
MSLDVTKHEKVFCGRELCLLMRGQVGKINIAKKERKNNKECITLLLDFISDTFIRRNKEKCFKATQTRKGVG